MTPKIIQKRLDLIAPLNFLWNHLFDNIFSLILKYFFTNIRKIHDMYLKPIPFIAFFVLKNLWFV